MLILALPMYIHGDAYLRQFGKLLVRNAKVAREVRRAKGGERREKGEEGSIGEG